MSNWAVIFDVDGTLYQQRTLRKLVLQDLLFYWSVHPLAGWQTIRILREFRKIRDRLGDLTSGDLENKQYQIPADHLKVSEDRVRSVVREWIEKRPLRHLIRCRYEGLLPWLNQLRKDGVKLGIYSDYPAENKLQALGIEVDAVVASTDPQVDSMKPSPKGLLHALQILETSAERALFVGDRREKDEVCAQAAGVAYLHIEARAPTSPYPPSTPLLPAWLAHMRNTD